MPEPPPEFEIFRCPNYLLRDPPCQGWVRAQGIKCNNCIANGWSTTSIGPSAGGLAQPDSVYLPGVKGGVLGESFNSVDAAESTDGWCMAKESLNRDNILLLDDMPQVIWQDMSIPEAVERGGAHYTLPAPHDLV